MDQEQQLFDKIEAFLKGKLPTMEHNDFEKEIANDPKLAELVELHRFELDSVEYIVEQDLRAKIKSWEKEPSPPKVLQKKSVPINWKLLVGIVFILFLIAFIVLKIVNREPEVSIKPEIQEEEIRTTIPEPESKPLPEKKEPVPPPKKEIAVTPQAKKDYLAIAQNNYQMPKSLSDVTVRGASDPREEDLLKKAFQLFDEKKWASAIAEFSKIDASLNPDEFDVAQEYLAHAYFNAGDFKSASFSFQSILDQELIIGQEEMEWFLLLSLLPDYNANKKRIDRLLDEMLNVEDSHKYAAQVKALGIKE